uniref:(California timema) hypothetical protein n=1 Tax=Timema californicum TaxID=61474 RepID=A0A7R9J1Y0_TIMCA|nr:unnamed protein product [Timema californicum]
MSWKTRVKTEQLANALVVLSSTAEDGEIEEIFVRHSSFKTSQPVKDITNCTQVEISRSPEEWKFVERLLPRKTVPIPLPKSEYPSGWKPPSGKNMSTNVGEINPPELIRILCGDLKITCCLCTCIEAFADKHLLVSPKDRRVVIVESLLCPTLFRETLAKALFQHFEVTSLLFTPSHLVTLCTLGVNTALVLDVGYQEAVLIPVYEGFPVLHAEIKTKLLSSVNGDGESNPAGLENLLDEIVEDIKVRTCFVTSLERAKKAEEGNAPPPPPDVSYSVGGLPSFNIPGRIREQAFEVLFQPDGDGNSIPTMILDSILKCSIDMRRPLAENILLIGGTAMTPGFKARLLAELKHLVLTSKYSSKIALQTFKFHTPPAKENYVAWLGGAIFGGTDILAARSLTKEVYMKTNEVPDWASLDYNRRDDEKISL